MKLEELLMFALIQTLYSLIIYAVYTIVVPKVLKRGHFGKTHRLNGKTIFTMIL